MNKLTPRELKFILTVLKIHKESYADFLRGFGERTELDFFLDDLIKKLEEK